MGNTNSTEENNLVASYQQRRRSRSNSSASIHKPTASTSTSSSTAIKKQPFQLTVTEPITETEPIPVKSNSTSTPPWSPTEPAIQEDTTIETKEIPINNKMKGDNEETPAKAVPVSTGKSGWVSSTGAASPWYGSLSSSTSSSHHRPSISGPYYRTRGMSVTRDSENDEDLTSIISNANAATPPINTTTNTTATKTVPLPSTNQGEYIQ